MMKLAAERGVPVTFVTNNYYGDSSASPAAARGGASAAVASSDIKSPRRKKMKMAKSPLRSPHGSPSKKKKRKTKAEKAAEKREKREKAKATKKAKQERAKVNTWGLLIDVAKKIGSDPNPELVKQYMEGTSGTTEGMATNQIRMKLLSPVNKDD